MRQPPTPERRVRLPGLLRRMPPPSTDAAVKAAGHDAEAAVARLRRRGSGVVPAGRARRLGMVGATVMVGAAAIAAAGWALMLPGNGSGAAAATLSPCRVAGVRNELRCGWLSRPLDPSRPDARHIAVRYVVVPALARRSAPDPVFFLAGGPGQSAVAVAGAVLPLLDRLNNRHDLVFVDQRGTGGSSPLGCLPETTLADETRSVSALAREADPEVQRAMVTRCLARLEALPALRTPAIAASMATAVATPAVAASGPATGSSPVADPGEPLQHFTTPIAVQDLDAVRAALGADRIDLLGISYGTRVGLEYLRQFPQHTRRLVLDGVAPADMALPRSMSADNQRALDAVFDACAGEPACARAHPDLRRRWRALLAAMPQSVRQADPLTGDEATTTLRRDTVLAAVRNALYLPSRAAALPAAIDAATRRRWDALVALSGLVAPKRDTDIAMGMHLSVVCSEDLPLLDQPPVDPVGDRPGVDFGDEPIRAYRQLCAGWPRAALPGGYGRVTTSAAPVLLLSGGLDPATPPRHAARVAAALGPKARTVTVANAGHNVLALPCLADLLFRFIEAPDDATALAADTGCAAGVPRPPAYAPPGTSL